MNGSFETVMWKWTEGEYHNAMVMFNHMQRLMIERKLVKEVVERN